jgi:hypothetical protein
MKFKQRCIYFFDCCTNGLSINGKNDIPSHYFLILSSNEYNSNNQGYLTAVPFSSKKNQTSGSYAHLLQKEDVEQIVNPHFLSKPTFLLADKICRINKNHLNINSTKKNKRTICKIKPSRYEDFINAIHKFIKAQN